AGKQSLAARVGEDLCVEPDVGRSAGLAAYWPGCDRGIAADLELVAEQFLNPLLVHEEEDEIGRLRADLQPEAAAPEIEERRRAPAPPRPAAGHAAPAAPADDESGFDHLREDGDAFGFVENISRDGLVGRAHDLAKDGRRLLRLRDGVFHLLALRG